MCIDHQKIFNKKEFKMKKCNYYREEKPFFRSIGVGGIEIEMIPVCSKPGLERLGVPSDIILCNGNPMKCLLMICIDQKQSAGTNDRF